MPCSQSQTKESPGSESVARRTVEIEEVTCDVCGRKVPEVHRVLHYTVTVEGETPVELDLCEDHDRPIRRLFPGGDGGEVAIIKGSRFPRPPKK